MKKLAQRFCFGLVAALTLSTVVITGCSRPQPQAPQGGAPAAEDNAGQPAAEPNRGSAQPTAILDGEISLARNFYFVFDGSGSMAGQKLVDAKQAVKEFLKTLPDDVNLGLYVFDRSGEREVLALGSNNRSQFLREIDQVRAGNGTPLGTSIQAGVKKLAKQREKQLQYGEYRLIVITDGDSDWGNPVETGTDEAASQKIPIFTIGFHIGDRHALRKYSITYRNANNLEELRKALEEAAAELDVFDPQSFKK